MPAGKMAGYDSVCSFLSFTMVHRFSRGMTVAMALFIVSFTGVARAFNITVESIISEAAARERAMEQVPEDAEVTATRCEEIGMAGGTFRYRCSVEYRIVPGQQGQP